MEGAAHARPPPSPPAGPRRPPARSGYRRSRPRAPPPRSPRRPHSRAGPGTAPGRRPPWRAALALVSSTASKPAGSGGCPGQRPDAEQRRDDRLEAQSPAPAPRSRRRPAPAAGSGRSCSSARTARASAGLAWPSSRRASSAGLVVARPPACTSRAVGGQDLGAQPDRAVAPLGQRRDRRAAVAAQRGEQGALGADAAAASARSSIAADQRPDVARSRRASRRRSRPAPAPAACRRATSRPRRCPSRSSPAAASRVASASPRSSLRSRVCDIAADRHDLEVRPPREQLRARAAARRCRPARPAAAPRGCSAPTSRSRTSARGSIAAIASSAGRIVSTSFIEWTDRSVRPSSRPRSSSLVHSALPPISASGRSWIRSPLVVIGTISIASSAPAMRVAQRRRHHVAPGRAPAASRGCRCEGAVHARACASGVGASGREGAR